MQAIHAIYENGRVAFSFDYPDYEGPVAVLVIFPDREPWPEDGDPGQPQWTELDPTGQARGHSDDP